MHEVDKTAQQLQSANGHPGHTLLKIIIQETYRAGAGNKRSGSAMNDLETMHKLLIRDQRRGAKGSL